VPRRDPVRGGEGPVAAERPAATPSPILRVEPVAASMEAGTAAARAARGGLEPALPGAAESNLSTTPSLPAGALSGPAAAPAQQVAAAVLAELPRGPAGAVPGALPGAPAGEGPLKLLTLQLHPADLGTVLVRMRLRDGQLEMNLQASREDSARLLREGGEVLNDLLRQGGYRPESVTVTVTSASAESRGASGNPGSQQGQGAQGFPGQSESGANQGRPTQDQAGRRSSPGGDPAASDLHERMHESVSSSPDRSGVYL
jgi:chemotaxis protein MotD